MAETLGSLCDKLTIVKLKQYHSDDPQRLESLALQAGQLQQEINLLKKLEHPNIVKYIGKDLGLSIIDSVYTDHFLNIILEFVENGSLDSLIKRFGKFPETLVAIYV